MLMQKRNLSFCVFILFWECFGIIRSIVSGKTEVKDGKQGGMKAREAMRDLPGDKSQTRSGLLRGWLRCAKMRIVTVGVFGVSAPWTAPEKEKHIEEVK